MPIYAHDLGRVMAYGIANARPLNGKGVRDAIEHVSLIPAASGAPSTRLRFGRYIRQGWMGAEYLVARRMTDAGEHVFHGTITGTVSSGAVDQEV